MNRFISLGDESGSDEEYNIEYLLGARWDGKVWYYQAHWFGHGSENDTWHPEGELTNLGLTDMVDRFWDERPGQRESRPIVGTYFQASTELKQKECRKFVDRAKLPQKKEHKPSQKVSNRPILAGDLGVEDEDNRYAHSESRITIGAGAGMKTRSTGDSGSEKWNPSTQESSESWLFASPSAPTSTTKPRAPTTGSGKGGWRIVSREEKISTPKQPGDINTKRKGRGQTKEDIMFNPELGIYKRTDGPLFPVPMSPVPQDMSIMNGTAEITQTEVPNPPNSPLNWFDDEQEDQNMEDTTAKPLTHEDTESRHPTSMQSTQRESNVISDPAKRHDLNKYDSVLISRNTPQSDVISRLSDHGCQDITDKLDHASGSKFPIAQGGYGDVYKSKLQDGTHVAIKTTRVYVDSSDEATKHVKRAARELHTWAQCDHPNVLKLIGLVLFRDQIGMVSPWMQEGGLPGYLERNPQVDRYHISMQISEGLAYLHRKNIIHGDLKGLNILVSDNGTPFLAGFGNAKLESRTLQFTTTSTPTGLSYRWCVSDILEVYC